ncbi:MAG: deoxyribose-phosphate aldolase [Bacteroidota bacterium]|nr:deoxyribose-phosphate aldolase [Bacteroidota bacterium]
MQDLFDKFNKNFDSVKVREQANALLLDSPKEMNVSNLKLLMGIIDLTTLNSTDSESRVKDFCSKVNNFKNSFNDIPNVAGICVFPSLVRVIHENLKEKGVEIVSVAAGFPASQTFLEIKLEESRLAVKAGATEIDIVLNLGQMAEKNYATVHDEVQQIKAAIGDAKLKVILETGVLSDYNLIWKASILAMDAGADFIKTSTGKINPAATPDAFLVMTLAISEFYRLTGKKTGIKPAGGISSNEDALIYFHIVKTILGKSWLNKSLFRLGASRLTNQLLSGIYELMGGKNSLQPYF